MQSSLLQKAPWWISLLLNVGHFFHYLVRMYSQNYCDVRPTEFKDFLVHTAFLNKVGNLEYKKILLKPLEKFFLEMKHSLFFFFLVNSSEHLLSHYMTWLWDPPPLLCVPSPPLCSLSSARYILCVISPLQLFSLLQHSSRLVQKLRIFWEQWVTANGEFASS